MGLFIYRQVNEGCEYLFQVIKNHLKFFFILNVIYVIKSLNKNQLPKLHTKMFWPLSIPKRVL